MFKNWQAQLYIGAGIVALAVVFVMFLFARSVLKSGVAQTITNVDSEASSTDGDPFITVVPEEYQNAEKAELTISANDPKRGPSDAPVTVVVFSDFQCEFCRDARDIMYQLERNFSGQIQTVWKDFPIPRVHPQAETAAIAARCAQQQGKFWEYHDQLFDNQSQLGAELYGSIAENLDLNTEAFNACLSSGATAALVQKNSIEGRALQIDGTPFFYINEQTVSGARNYAYFETLVQTELQAAAQGE